MFHDRIDAATRLAALLEGRPLRDPIVLGIPRGGIVVGVALARALGADFDVVLARKLRAPGQPELAIGAVGEDGRVHFNSNAAYFEGADGYVQAECARQRAEIERRRSLFRQVRPQAPLEGRSVLVTDDGLATGSTMIAALDIVRARDPHEVIVAVPVAAPDRLAEVRRHCDDAVCLRTPRDFIAIGAFYEDFRQVSDEEAIRLLRDCCIETADMRVTNAENRVE